MKIAVVGTSCVGKSTYIQDFLKAWPMYETPKISYRDLIKEKNIPCNREGTEDSQRMILDFLAEQATQYSKKDNVIFDRCVLDNLAYSSWLHLNEKVSERFLDETRILTRESLRLFDIIFFLPVTKTSPIKIVEDNLRDTNPEFRQEIDNIFKIFQQSYNQGDGRVFPKDDSPAFIEIFGTPEQRIELTKLYLKEDGKPYAEEQSLIATP